MKSLSGVGVQERVESLVLAVGMENNCSERKKSMLIASRRRGERESKGRRRRRE